MKKTDHDIESLVEETLRAFDGASRAKPKPFLLTRIMARKENKIAGSENFMSPALQNIGLAFIIMIIAFNIYTATTFFQNPASTDGIEENESAFVENLYPSAPGLDNITLTTSNP